MLRLNVSLVLLQLGIQNKKGIPTLGIPFIVFLSAEYKTGSLINRGMKFCFRHNGFALFVEKNS